ncbi:MAG: phosphatase PAP2 family protein [Glaciimonas sp.]|nr:phosphatase PAP2 family protein [Glaciimonas sp.]
MEQLNQALFLLMNAQDPNPVLLTIAKLCANQLIWLVPMAVLVGWLSGAEKTRKFMLQATAAAILGMLLNQLIGLVWQHPRPFVMGLGHNFVPHAADSSFPSDHLTLLLAVAFSFLLHQRLRVIGLMLTLMGLPVAWSRIYVGLHFPLDMLGAVVFAALSTGLGVVTAKWYLEPAYYCASTLHRRMFAPFIRRGWMVK